MSERRGWLLLGAVPVLFLTAFFLYPVGAVLLRGFGADSASLTDIVTRPALRGVVWFTFWQAAASTLLTLVAAAPLTAVLANYRFRGRALLRALVTVPFVLPTVVVAAAFVALLDRFGLDEGSLNLRHTIWVVLAAHVFFNIAVVVRTVGGFWSQLDDRQEQAARSLGASPLRAFWEVTLPRLRSAILAATAIVFLFTFTSFGLILLLGGPRMASIETEIFRYAVSRTDFSTAAALSILQLVAVVALVVVSSRLQRHVAGSERLAIDRAKPFPSIRHRFAAMAISITTIGFLGLPIASLVERSLRTGDSYGFGHYRGLTERVPLLPVSALQALRNSITFGFAAAVLALIVGGTAALFVALGPRREGRLLDLGLLLPLGTSAVTLGFGMLIALDKPPLDLRQSWVIIPIAQALIGVPFVVRAIVPVLQAIDPKVREAAATLGATPWAVRREIDVPLAAKAAGVGGGFAFAIAIGEFGATSFVGRKPDFLTVPLSIARLLGQPGDSLRGQAMALSVVLMIVTTVVVFLVDRRGQAGVL